MSDLTLDTTDTRKITEKLLFALKTTKMVGLTPEGRQEGRVRFVQSIFDEFRHQILFRQPSIN